MVAVLTGITAEAVFGGGVLLVMLGLLISGKLRLEREIHTREEIIKKKTETIAEQWEAIRVLTHNHEVTHDLLQAIRQLAEGHRSQPHGGLDESESGRS